MPGKSANALKAERSELVMRKCGRGRVSALTASVSLLTRPGFAADTPMGMRSWSLVLSALAVLSCAGCGQASVVQSSAHAPPQRTAGASSSAQRTRTTPNRTPSSRCRSFPAKRPNASGASSDHLGSCSPSDVSAVLAVVARFRRAITSGVDVCDLLTPYERANAERWAHQPLPPDAPSAVRHHQTCSTMALYVGNATTFPGTNPIGEILTFPASAHAAFDSQVGPAPRGAIVAFAPQGASHGLNILVVAIGRRWLINQIGYQF